MFEDTDPQIESSGEKKGLPKKQNLPRSASDPNIASREHDNNDNASKKRKLPPVEDREKLFTPTASYMAKVNAEQGHKRQKREKKREMKRSNSETDLSFAGGGEVEAERNLRTITEKIDKGDRKGTPIETPWGPTKITPSETGSVYQMMVSTTRENYPNSSTAKNDKWTEYDTWVKYLNKVSDEQLEQYSHQEDLDDYADPEEVIKQRAKDIRNVVENGTIQPPDDTPESFYKDNQTRINPDIYDDNQKRAAASLYTAVAHSEEYRIDGGKQFSVDSLKYVEETGDFKDFQKTFTLSGGGGVQHTAGIISHTVIPDSQERELETFRKSLIHEGHQEKERENKRRRLMQTETTDKWQDKDIVEDTKNQSLESGSKDFHEEKSEPQEKTEENLTKKEEVETDKNTVVSTRSFGM